MEGYLKSKNHKIYIVSLLKHLEIVLELGFLTEKNYIFLLNFWLNKLALGQSPNDLIIHFKKWPYLYKLKNIFMKNNDNTSQRNLK